MTPEVPWTVAVPEATLLDVWSEEQIAQLVTDLRHRRRVLRALNYLAEGADRWASYDGGLWDRDLLEHLAVVVDDLRGTAAVHVVDVGVGDGRAVLPLLSRLIGSSALDGYSAVDISARMLQIAQGTQQIAQGTQRAALGGAGAWRSFVRDVTAGSLQDVLVHRPGVINLIACLGGTLGNLDDEAAVLRNLAIGAAAGDLLAFTHTVVDPVRSGSFAASVAEGAGRLAERHRYVFDVLGIPASAYVPVQGTRPDGVRFRSARFVEPVRIAFSRLTEHEDVELAEGDEVELWFCRDLRVEDAPALVGAAGLRHLRTAEQGRGALVVAEVTG